MPSTPEMNQLSRFIKLQDKFGLALYFVNSIPHLSLIVFDFESQVYTFVGQITTVLDKHGQCKWMRIMDFSLLSDDLISIVSDQTLHFFELNFLKSSITFRLKVKAPKNGKWFKKLNGKIFFVRADTHFVRYGQDEPKIGYYIYGLAKINDNGSRTELANTDIRLQTALHDNTFGQVKFCPL